MSIDTLVFQKSVLLEASKLHSWRLTNIQDRKCQQNIHSIHDALLQMWPLPNRS